MQGLMAACQEISFEDLETLRSGGDDRREPDPAAVAALVRPAAPWKKGSGQKLFSSVKADQFPL